MNNLDTIIIKAPAGTKAKWVRQSQRDGKKLSDWLVEKIENTMKTFKVNDSVSHQYKGAGWALAATINGELVALRYLDDVASDAVSDEIHEYPSTAKQTVKRWLDSPSAGQVVRELQSLGEIHVGMCSAWEFVEL